MVRSEDEARSFASEKGAKGLDLFGRSFLLGDQVVEPEDHQRIGIGENPFVDRQFLPGLIDALVDGDGPVRYFADGALKAQQRQMKQLQRSLDALKEHLFASMVPFRTPAMRRGELRSSLKSDYRAL